MTFYLKRPGQREGRPLTGPEDYERPGCLDAGIDEWSLHLPHQCDAWEIGYGTREETLAEAYRFRDELAAAIQALEAGELAAARGVLTSSDAEPGYGAVVRDVLGRLWSASGSGPCAWTLVDGDEPESWAKVAGNYGLVAVIEEAW
jgi:hypothetical protein